MKLMWILMALPLAVFLLFFLWASYPWQLSPKIEAQAFGRTSLARDPESLPSTVTVLTWNMAYAYGLGSEGTADYVPRSRESFEQNLKKIAQSIRDSGADIVLLQEIDFAAARSHGLDQLDLLSTQTGLGFWARAVSWEAQYIPFPFTPVSHQFGRMRSGGAVLSRWPITANRVHLLAKPESRAWWYNLFYLYRYFQEVTVKILDRDLRLVNLHLEAFDQTSRDQQARQLVELATSQKFDFIAGDFNMLPAGAMKRSGFENPQDVYETEKTYEILKDLPLTEIVAPVAYLQKEESWFTFPSLRPDRRLDYIYHSEERALISAEVFQTPHADVSDHLPLKATFKLFRPDFIRD